MAQQIVNVGNTASDGTGDELRDAFTKINQNFTELYSGNVQITAANIRVFTVAGRDGNVVLTVNDVAQAASKAYVNSAIASNVATLESDIVSVNANLSAANTQISNHASRITSLESNAATQASQISTLTSQKADVTYVDTSIEVALSSNAYTANISAINANIAAANVNIATKANISGQVFTGNTYAPWVKGGNLAIDGFIKVGTAAGQDWANPAAVFFGDTRLTYDQYQSRYYQVNLQNIDPEGSGDFIITADDGNSFENVLSVGLSGSAYNDTRYPELQPHDGYVWLVGGNLLLHSQDRAVQFFVANTNVAEFNQAHQFKLNNNTAIIFPDGTRQTTAFGGNTNVTAINANITAANAAITALQANATIQALEFENLWSNATSQATTLNTLLANATAQQSTLSVLQSNVVSLIANDATQADSISSLTANAATQAAALATLTANSAVQSLDIDNLFANAGTQGQAILALNTALTANLNILNANLGTATNNISTLLSNAAAQAVSLNTLSSNAATQAVTLNTLLANAATQALLLDSLQTDVNIISINNSNIASAFYYQDANLGVVNLDIDALTSNLTIAFNDISAISSNLLLKANSNSPTFTGNAVFLANVTSENLIANANLFVNDSVHVGLYNDELDDAALALSVTGNVAGPYRIHVHNLNPGSNASSDILLFADDGDFTDNYLNIGMNSSNFSGNFIVPAGDTNLPEYPRDGYFTVIGGNIALRTDNFVYIAANTSVVLVPPDGDLTLFNTNLQFRDGTVQSTAVPDVPALFANIGTIRLDLDTLDANVGSQLYTMGNYQNWSGNVTTISAALDQLAARIKSLGG